MISLVIAVAAFIGVAALVGAAATFFLARSGNETLEDRLDVLAGAKSTLEVETERALLSSPLDDVPSQLEAYFSKAFNVRLMLERAEVEMAPLMFLGIVAALGAVGTIIPILSGMPFWVGPLFGLCVAILPFVFLTFKFKMRMRRFAKQLPQALELMSRALRAGHSLQAGFQLVGTETQPPLGPEFHRVFDEQNFGVSLEDALETMTDRVPNLDLKFFATAVILQRQTGGDLAEILDKIGHLIRERFKIYGQIQALTGEGRLSGIVLLALPPFLFVTMLKLNPDYVMLLFTDEMGKKLLAVTIVLQLLGAVVIKKIINIKV